MTTNVPLGKNRARPLAALREAMGERFPVSLHRTRSPICVVIAAVSGMVLAHVAHAADSATAAEYRQEACRTVILRLRDGDIQQAMKSLEAVYDGTAPNTLVDDEGPS